MISWGEPEQALHRRVCCGICRCCYIYNYVYIVRHAGSHFWLLFCEFLCHSLFQKLARRHELSASLMATARTETTRGPTYSMATMGATTWQKGFICQCHYLHCHSQWKSLVTCPPMATSMRAIACHRRWRECHLSVDTSCKAHGVLDLCACSNHTHWA